MADTFAPPYAVLNDLSFLDSLQALVRQSILELQDLARPATAFSWEGRDVSHEQGALAGRRL
jgi:hypothetical protein